MFNKLRKRFKEKERTFRTSFGRDISDPKERRKSQWHFDWLDHGILRKHWHNYAQVAPGVFRANHPDDKRFTAYAAQGIKTIINLRGAAQQAHYLFEAESCARLGLTLIDIPMSARMAPPVKSLRRLFRAFDAAERPLLMHCKSGADRTGLAAVLYLMTQENVPFADARQHLSFRYLHIRRTDTGILDHFFDVYAARNAQDPIGIREWIRTEYDPDALTASFAAKRASQRFWQGWR
ncbi:fused DSP-PTPase phosphatase/NAD kinase-like protein [Yoonia sp.]|uniref:fused DSP-PTPase phosphatase/NAD kinase-like protein n=1 Tax=Yoonia sp. TaxID=2212373 RepID=UPI003F4A98EE